MDPLDKARAYDAPWVCGYCGRHWVVPGLARSCEAKHEAEQ